MTVGQYDAIISPAAHEVNDFGDFKSNQEHFLNLTKINEVTATKYNLAPRLQFCAADARVVSNRNSQACLMFADTELERSIGIGTEYEF